MEYLKIANSVPMWIASGIAVAVVLVQAFLFARKSIKVSKEIGVEEKQIRSAIKSSAISSIGPSLAILVGMVSLLVAMGGAISWMRLSFIGSVMFELMAAGIGTKALGGTLGGEGMTDLAFANGVWIMVIGSVGWLVFTGLFTHKMNSFRNILAGGKKAMLPIISSAAMLGAFGYVVGERVVKFDKGAVACVAGFCIMIIISFIEKKTKAHWLKEWALAFASFGGIIITALV